MASSNSFPFLKSNVVLGKGGSGSVFLGIHCSEERQKQTGGRQEDLVAIKRRFIAPDARHNNNNTHNSDTTITSNNMNEDESQILSGIPEHDCVVKVLASSTSNEFCHFAMPLMKSDLGHEMGGAGGGGSKRRFSVPEAAWVMSQLLSGVEHLHRHGVVHRDVKPSNLLLAPGTSPRSPLRVLLGDFGVAHFATDDARPAMNYRGTRFYQPPEILYGRFESRLARACDMWACGCVLVEVLTGTPVFPGDSALDMLNMILSRLGSSFGEYPASRPADVTLCDILPRNTPQSCIDLILRLLDLNPETRITAAAALDHPFLAEAANVTSIIALRGYRDVNVEQIVFRPLLLEAPSAVSEEQQGTCTCGGGGRGGGGETSLNSSDMSSQAACAHCCGNNNTSYQQQQQDTSHHSSVYLDPASAAKHATGERLTLSNLRTNTLFNLASGHTSSTPPCRLFMGPTTSPDTNNTRKQLFDDSM